MGISEDLKNFIEHGDYKRIADYYNKGFENEQQHVTRQYVSMVIRGVRTNRNILKTAESYLRRKKEIFS
ncbi:MAG: hypothetical protein AAF363_08155 [Bacteroidota bacterium]